ncbi:hypothetical protein WJX72_011440 [[Myrmecia] bisecta]|uniref:Nucleotide-diphospho-sugar transferase domain-containing protein n=1 Tax=[Myrmecia] bisecta TaxID=41462 RepID=A0AAW1Q1T6_9CHLO
MLVCIFPITTTAAAMSEACQAGANTGGGCGPARRLQAVDSTLTRELLAEVAVDNTVVVAQANLKFLDFLQNWIWHLEAVGMRNYVVAAMDRATLDRLQQDGIRSFLYTSSELFDSEKVFTRDFGLVKARLINEIIDLGFNLLYSDLDVVWLRDPFPYFAHFPDLDLLITTDLWDNLEEADPEWDLSPTCCLNIGAVLLRATPVVAQFLHHWLGILEEGLDTIWDQMVFHMQLHMAVETSVSNGSHFHRGFAGKLPYGVLPDKAFPEGRAFAGDYDREVYGLRHWIAHMDFMGTSVVKRHLFREYGLWAVDPPEYFHFPGGFLTYQPAVPQDWLQQTLLSGEADRELRWRAHIRIIEYQQAQIRVALAISSALGRALILPRIYSGFRSFALRKPIWVARPIHLPAKSVLSIDDMEKGNRGNQALLGPTLHFRDYAFMTRPGFPVEFNASVVQVVVGNADAVPGAQQGQRSVVLQPLLTDRQLVAALEEVKDAKILHFSDVRRAWGGFAHPRRELQFQRQTAAWFKSPYSSREDLVSED